jgi:hypothetical protein
MTSWEYKLKAYSGCDELETTDAGEEEEEWKALISQF